MRHLARLVWQCTQAAAKPGPGPNHEDLVTRCFTLPHGRPLSLYQVAEADPAMGSAPSAPAIPYMGRNLSISKIPQLLLNLQFMVTTARSEMNPLEGFILETLVHWSSENSSGMVWQTHNDHQPSPRYCHRQNPFTPLSDGCFCESQSERTVPEKCHALEDGAPGWGPERSAHALEVRSPSVASSSMVPVCTCP